MKIENNQSKPFKTPSKTMKHRVFSSIQEKNACQHQHRLGQLTGEQVSSLNLKKQSFEF